MRIKCRGKKGGLSEYAAKIGKKAPDITNYRQAGEVVKALDQSNGFSLSVFLGRAQHLAAIRKLPAELREKVAAVELSIHPKA